MRKVTKLMQTLEQGAILEEVKAALREIDPGYSEEENAYTQGIQAIRASMPPERLEEALELIEWKKRVVASDLMFLLWQGLRLNLECFEHPAGKLFLQLDYEDICREEIMRSMPAAREYQTKASTFFHSLTDKQYDLFEPVNAYYDYIRTVAYKLAHYYGFLLGDHLLPCVIPGYVPDPLLTVTYSKALHNTLGMDIRQLIS